MDKSVTLSESLRIAVILPCYLDIPSIKGSIQTSRNDFFGILGGFETFKINTSKTSPKDKMKIDDPLSWLPARSDMPW